MPAQPPETATRALAAAERLVQIQGYNGFSYADVAAALQITKAALHYHFPTKGDLGLRLIERYHAAFLAALARIDAAETGATARLTAYARIYEDVLAQERMCLCGMLAAESATLPPPMRAALTGFFDANEAWLTAVLRRGRTAGELEFTGPPADAAAAFVAALEGAMLLARARGDITRFRTAASRLLAGFGVRRAGKGAAA